MQFDRSLYAARCHRATVPTAISGRPGRRFWARRAARTVWLAPEEAEFAAEFVLVDDRGRVAVADAVLVGEPVGALFTAEEGGAGF